MLATIKSLYHTTPLEFTDHDVLRGFDLGFRLCPRVWENCFIYMPIGIA